VSSHDDGLPDEAFTDLERAAGVPALMRSSNTVRSSKHPTEEIAASIGQDALVAVLLDGLCHGGLEVFVEAQVADPLGGEYGLEVFAEWPDKPHPNLYLRIESEHYVPISFLIDTLRRIRVPLLLDDGRWMAWDTREQRLKQTPVAGEALWTRARARTPEASLDERETGILQMLHRAALTTDHGKKPLLLHKELLQDALHRREVEFVPPGRLTGRAIDEYVLAW
jgi:hypothetical protein